MGGTVFLEADFFALIVFSIIAPLAIYLYLMRARSISRNGVLWFGLLMIALAAVDVFLLQRLRGLARGSSSAVDDHIFTSELSVALYLLPALFAGIGVNMVSHILIRHLTEAEKQYERDHEGNHSE